MLASLFELKLKRVKLLWGEEKSEASKSQFGAQFASTLDRINIVAFVRSAFPLFNNSYFLFAVLKTKLLKKSSRSSETQSNKN